MWSRITDRFYEALSSVAIDISYEVAPMELKSEYIGSILLVNKIRKR